MRTINGMRIEDALSVDDARGAGFGPRTSQLVNEACARWLEKKGLLHRGHTHFGARITKSTHITEPEK